MLNAQRLDPPGSLSAGTLKIGYLMIVLGFIGFVPLLVALIIAYADRGETPLAATHRSFQIRTVWATMILCIPAFAMAIVLFFFGLSFVPLLLVYAWSCVRAIRGWRLLNEGLPHPHPETLGLG